MLSPSLCRSVLKKGGPLLKNFTTKQLKKIMIGLLFVVAFEIIFFNFGGGLLLIFSALFLYLGANKQRSFFFWLGVFFLLLAILNLWSLRVLCVAVFLYILYKHFEEQKVTVQFDEVSFKTGIVQKNRLIETNREPAELYKWQDIQVQHLFGDFTIDITETILPTGTSVITVRQGIGKVKIIVPYEVPIKLQFSTLLGEATLLNHSPKRLVNERIVFEDGDAENAKRKLVIHVASWLGDVEVIRK